MFDVAGEDYYCISKGRTFPPDIGEMWQILVAMIGNRSYISWANPTYQIQCQLFVIFAITLLMMFGFSTNTAYLQ